MPLLLADFIYSRDCKFNLRKNVDTTDILLVATKAPFENKRRNAHGIKLPFEIYRFQ